jgi:hypothetical protein
MESVGSLWQTRSRSLNWTTSASTVCLVKGKTYCSTLGWFYLSQSQAVLGWFVSALSRFTLANFVKIEHRMLGRLVCHNFNDKIIHRMTSLHNRLMKGQIIVHLDIKNLKTNSLLNSTTSGKFTGSKPTTSKRRGVILVAPSVWKNMHQTHLWDKVHASTTLTIVV